LQTESFVKTLDVKDAYVMDNETHEHVAAGSPRFIDAVYKGWPLHSALGYLTTVELDNRNARTFGKTAA
jgi:hypothetical protein